MIQYNANWERAALGLVCACTVQLLAASVLLVAAPRSALGGVVWLTSFVAWCLPSLVVLGNSWSTFRISDDKFLHLRFGRVIAEIPIEELESLDIAPGVDPGKFRFKKGRIIRVSGIALGSSGAVEKYLQAIGVSVNEHS